jgi:hypothetical protein
MRFSEFILDQFPNHVVLTDYWIESNARSRCETEVEFKNNPPKFDEKISIRHHRMTIALAMPQRKNHGL